MEKKSEEEWNEIFRDTHLKGETCRITIHLFMQHYGLKPVVDQIAEHIVKSLEKNQLKPLGDFMVVTSQVFSKEEMDDIDNAKPKDVRGWKIKW